RRQASILHTETVLPHGGATVWLCDELTSRVQGFVDCAQIKGGESEDKKHDNSHHTRANEKAEYGGQCADAGFGLLFVLAGGTVHRMDDFATFFGHRQCIDEVCRKRARASECQVKRIAGGDIAHDLVRVADVVVVARGAQHE